MHAERQQHKEDLEKLDEMSASRPSQSTLPATTNQGRVSPSDMTVQDYGKGEDVREQTIRNGRGH